MLLFYCNGTQPIKTRITYRFCWYCDVHKLVWNNANGDRKSFWLVANQAQAERSYFRLKYTNATQSTLPPKSNLRNQLLSDEFFSLLSSKCARKLPMITNRNVSFRFDSFSVLTISSSFHFLYNGSSFEALPLPTLDWFVSPSFSLSLARFQSLLLLYYVSSLFNRNWFIVSAYL